MAQNSGDFPGSEPAKPTGFYGLFVQEKPIYVERARSLLAEWLDSRKGINLTYHPRASGMSLRGSFSKWTYVLGRRRSRFMRPHDCSDSWVVRYTPVVCIGV
jgi:hypothetical protein